MLALLRSPRRAPKMIPNEAVTLVVDFVGDARDYRTMTAGLAKDLYKVACIWENYKQEMLVQKMMDDVSEWWRTAGEQSLVDVGRGEFFAVVPPLQSTALVARSTMSNSPHSAPQVKVHVAK